MHRRNMASVAILSIVTATVHAQTAPDKTLDRVEARLGRIEYREPPAMRGLVAAEEKHWSLGISAPFTFNDNVANSETGGQQAFHGDPTLTLGGQWNSGSTMFFVESNADLDTYTAHHDNDNATFSGQAGVKFGDPAQNISPYFHYTILSLFAGQFDDHTVTIHHFTLGAKRIWPTSQNSQLSIDMNVLRREATNAAVEQNRGTVSLTYSGELDERTSWSLGGRGQYVKYTGSTSSGREDAIVRVLGGLTRTIGTGVSIDLSASFQRDWSDRAGKSYSVWDFGPTLSFVTSF